MHRLLCSALLLAACATPSPAPSSSATPEGAKADDETPVELPASQRLARADEPGRLLASFESTDELRGSRAFGADLALGAQGATAGQKALKITAADGALDKDGKVLHGLRFTYAPAQSWAEMNEVAVDVSNPGDSPQHLQVTLIDAAHPAAEARRKGFVVVPAHTAETVRLPLSDSSTPVPPAQRTGVVARQNHVDIDLAHVQALWLLMDRLPAGESLLFDNLRLVRRDAQGLAIAPAPKKRLPHVAVLDVVDVTGELGPRAQILTTLVYDTCAAAKTSDVISSAEIREMLGAERQRQLVGCTESSCLAEIAGALGSDYLLSSQVGKLGTRLRIDVRLIDAGKAKVLASAGDFVAAGSDDGLADALAKLVKQVLQASPLAG